MRFSRSKYTKMRLQPGLRPIPKLQSSPDPLACFQGAASRQGRGKGEEKEEKEEKGRG